MRVKPIFKYGLVAGALALPAAAYALGLGKLTVESYVGQPLVARIELLSASKDELDTLSAQDRRSVAVPPEQPAIPGRAVAHARHARTRPRRHRLSARDVRRAGQRAVPRPAGRGELVRRAASCATTRSCSILRAAAADRRPDHADCVPGTAPPASRAHRCRRPQPHRPRLPRAPSAPRAAGRHVRSQARRHAVQDRQGIQARDRDARPDAGRAVQEQPERVRGQQHESPAFRRDHHDPERGRSVVSPGTAKRTQGGARAGRRLARATAIASRVRRRRSRKAAAAAPVARIGTAVEDTTPAARPGSDQLRVSKEAGSGTGAGVARRPAPRRPRSCARRKAASPSSRRR